MIDNLCLYGSNWNKLDRKAILYHNYKILHSLHNGKNVTYKAKVIQPFLFFQNNGCVRDSLCALLLFHLLPDISYQYRYWVTLPSKA